ncbi:MAG: hypothetical protein KGH64_01085 [Candidatus Micrarchaeota archaeon]|nr:hypothetical protein [Candidatus Micrarchaeota archaeon]MDE1833911.1 hypothetical protein [Candidatus Micrarchaeota archaeon]MDE1859887.1 hypothetical protein [Candidatus Micrarchaeota archaeon]
MLNILKELSGADVKLKARPTPYLEGYHFSRFPYMENINALATTLDVPVITWGPDGRLGHAPNEYVTRKSLRELTEMYIALLRTI